MIWELLEWLKSYFRLIKCCLIVPHPCKFWLGFGPKVPAERFQFYKYLSSWCLFKFPAYNKPLKVQKEETNHNIFLYNFKKSSWIAFWTGWSNMMRCRYIMESYFPVSDWWFLFNFVHLYITHVNFRLTSDFLIFACLSLIQ